MSGKYSKLTEYLASVDVDPVTMTFDKIEEVIGDTLPDSARKHTAWWVNNGKGQSQAWLAAGFRATSLVLDERRLMFTRQVELLQSTDDDAFVGVQPLTIQEAKAGLAKKLGISMNSIEITIKC